MTRRWMVLLTLAAPSAWAQTATFDGLPEGTNGSRITDNGIRFTNLDNALDPIPGNMAIEDASDNLTGLPGFSARNCLGFGGYSEGGGAAFGRFRSVEISRSEPSDAARVEVFDMGTTAVTLHLEAWLGDQLVNSDDVVLPLGWTITHHTLQVHGEPFDRLRLVVDPDTGGVAFLLLDDVQIAALGGGDTDATGDTDTGEVGPDAGGTDTDVKVAGARPDNTGDGSASDLTPQDAGCACTHSDRPAPLWFGLGALVVARRRRRDTTVCAHLETARLSRSAAE